KFGCHRRQSIKPAVGPSELEDDILALGETVFSQAPAKAFHQIGVGARRSPTHEPDHRHRRLLRAPCEPPCRRAAEQGNELTPPHHSIPSSALACKVSGTARPSALAVFKLTTSSNLVGCMTGISAGRAPLRI